MDELLSMIATSCALALATALAHQRNTCVSTPSAHQGEIINKVGMGSKAVPCSAAAIYKKESCLRQQLCDGEREGHSER